MYIHIFEISTKFLIFVAHDDLFPLTEGLFPEFLTPRPIFGNASYVKMPHLTYDYKSFPTSKCTMQRMYPNCQNQYTCGKNVHVKKS